LNSLSILLWGPINNLLKLLTVLGLFLSYAKDSIVVLLDWNAIRPNVEISHFASSLQLPNLLFDIANKAGIHSFPNQGLTCAVHRLRTHGHGQPMALRLSESLAYAFSLQLLVQS
jgi:hypothetical protein